MKKRTVWHWWNKISEAGHQQWEAYKAEQLKQLSEQGHAEEAPKPREPDMHECLLENTDIIDKANPKSKKTEPITWVKALFALIFLCGVVAMMVLNVVGILNYATTGSFEALAPLWLNLTLFLVISILETALVSAFLYKRRSKAIARRDLNQIYFQMRTLLQKNYYRGTIKDLELEEPTPNFNSRDIEVLYAKALIGEDLKSTLTMTKEEKTALLSKVEDIHGVFKFMLDPKYPVTSWIMPFKGWGYYRDSAGNAIEKQIEIWMKGISLRNTYSKWVDVEESTGWGTVTQHCAMFSMLDMGWRKRKIKDEKTGAYLEAWHPVFAIVGDMPYGLREHLFGAATEKIIKTCEDLPTVDYQDQTITGLQMTIGRLNRGNRENRRLDNSTQQLGSVLSTTVQPLPENLQPNGGNVPQPNGAQTVKPKGKWNWDRVSLLFLGIAFLAYVVVSHFL